MIRNAQELPPERSKPIFSPGQIVKHKRYSYRGVIVQVDPQCQASEQWYWKNQTQPSRDQPWYHVFVDGSDGATYPAQENLLADTADQPINHPLLEYFFSRFENGRYIRNDQPWPSE